MKKILFATTALVASAAAGAAFAAEKPVGTIGGYMGFGAGLSDANPSGDTEVTILRDGEIFLGFKGSSDNGLTFTGRVELEAFTTGDQIDENWAQVSGSFGSILVGSNDTAGDNFGDVGILYGPLARLAYYDGFGVVPMAFSDDGGADPIGIRYATPTIAGFTAAVSYHPNSGFDGAGDTPWNASSSNGSGAQDDIVSLAANYEGEFGGLGMKIGGDYTFADSQVAGVDDMNVWSVGTELNYAGFVLGVHYEDNEGTDSDDLAIGAGYKTGPWGITGGWAMSDEGGSDIDTWAGWVTYALAPGVTAAAGFEYGDVDGGGDAYQAVTYLTVGF